MKRQGLQVTVRQLNNIIEELEKENTEWNGCVGAFDDDKTFQINIINKKGLSDTWEIEE